MSLTNCPDCNTEISSTAETCPKCGFPMKDAPINVEARERKLEQFLEKEKQEDKSRTKGLISIFAAFVLAFVWADLDLIPEGPAEWPVRIVAAVVFIWFFWVKGIAKLR